jgi:hypothetical protein
MFSMEDCIFSTTDKCVAVIPLNVPTQHLMNLSNGWISEKTDLSVDKKNILNLSEL